MILGVDFGSSNTDIVLFDRHKKKIIKQYFVNSSEGRETLKSISDIILNGKNKISKICVTGFGARFFRSRFEGLPVKKINEIKAIALGSEFLSKERDFMAVSMGSGTCFVLKKGRLIKHIGGTAIGGATLLGLSRLLIKTDSFKPLEDAALKGHLNRTDLELKDIYPKGVGILRGEITAAHFGRLKNPSNKDISLGLFNMVAQAIATNALFAAKAYDQSKIVMVGRLSESKVIRKTVREKVSCLFPSVKFLFVKNAGIAVSCGAALA